VLHAWHELIGTQGSGDIDILEVKIILMTEPGSPSALAFAAFPPLPGPVHQETSGRVYIRPIQ
jgi:hypothetical protein